MEEMEIDEIELERQRKAELLSRKGIAKVEIIVTDNGSDIPFCNLMAHDVSLNEMAKLCICMDSIRERIYEDHPQVKLLEKLLGATATKRTVEGTKEQTKKHIKELRGEEE